MSTRTVLTATAVITIVGPFVLVSLVSLTQNVVRATTAVITSVVVVVRANSCSFDSNCGDQKYCCNKECGDSCIGQLLYSYRPCYVNSDCGDYSEYCCSGKCRKEKCVLSLTWIIIISVFSYFIFVGVIVGAVLVYNRACFNKGSTGVVLSAPPVTTTIVTNSNISYDHFRSDFQPPLMQS